MEATQSQNTMNNNNKITSISVNIFQIVMLLTTCSMLLFISYNYYGGLLFLVQFSSVYGRNSSEFLTPLIGGEVVKDEYYELKMVLEAASTKEKTVILTTLNNAWAEPNSIIDLFLESFRIGINTTPLLNHLVVVAVGKKAYIRCQELSSHCYFFKTNISSDTGYEAKYMTPAYLNMVWEKLSFLQTVLKLGYNFVFTDVDVMWLRNPFPHFDHDSDFQTSIDHFKGSEFDIRNNPNTGFFFVRSNDRTIRFYDLWISSRHIYPMQHDQSVLDEIKDNHLARQIGMKIRFIGTDYFGGFCQPSRDFNKVCTMHANCCIGLDNKKADLNTTLEVWKAYLTSNHKPPQFFDWGVPKQCIL